MLAEVYDIKSRKVWQKSAVVDIPEDGVVNDVFKIDFPEELSQVHFIKLRLLDDKGKQVGSNFYWRSRDKYEGAKTLTGPATSGFESIDQLPEVKLSAKYKTRTENGSYFIDVELKMLRGILLSSHKYSSWVQTINQSDLVFIQITFSLYCQENLIKLRLTLP